MIQKSLKDISWICPESEYRADPAISYSTLAKYEREGFNKLSTLFDRVESPSLTFGSMCDVLITGSQEEFDSLYFVCDFPKTDDSVIRVVDIICMLLPEDYVGTLNDVKDQTIKEAVAEASYHLNWKEDTRVRVIREQGNDYFMMKMASQGRTVVNTELYTQVMNCVDALKTSEATKWYFQEDSPFENIERLYQLKFKGDYEGIPVRIMMDLAIINHDEKWILPIDLKTSYKNEWDFPKSFVEWLYPYQCGLYSYVLKQNIMKDDYFKDFKILNYRDIVINKESCTPLVWEYNQTWNENDIILGEHKIRPWRKALKELSHYLKDEPKVPDGISLVKPNSIEDYFKK